MKTLERKYSTTVKAKGGKDANIISDDGLLNLPYQPPKELKGNGQPGKHTNPEQLLAAGYASCLGSSIQLTAEKLQLDVKPENIEVAATVHMGNDDEGSGFGYSIDLVVDIQELTMEEQHRILEIAQKECPYTKALEGNVPINVSLL